MAWPKIEAHFASIDKRGDRTHVVGRVYTATDGGIDAAGNQVYIRTLRRTLTLKLDAGLDSSRLVSNLRGRRVVLNAEFGTNVSDADFICTL